VGVRTQGERAVARWRREGGGPGRVVGPKEGGKGREKERNGGGWGRRR